MTRPLLLAIVLSAACIAVAQSPKPSLEQKLQQTEARLAKVAASHDDVMKRMRQIEANLDALLKKIRESRQKLGGKP